MIWKENPLSSVYSSDINPYGAIDLGILALFLAAGLISMTFLCGLGDHRLVSSIQRVGTRTILRSRCYRSTKLIIDGIF